MCCLTGGAPALQWPACSNRLAVLACVHCKGEPLLFQSSIRPRHFFILVELIFAVFIEFTRIYRYFTKGSYQITTVSSKLILIVRILYVPT